MKVNKVELSVGAFVLLGIAALLVLALKIADSQFGNNTDTYTLYAKFDNIGGLKARSPVKVGGVVVGRVEQINLDIEDYMPKVTLSMYRQYGYYPETSSLSILTAGLLGEQYIGLTPGFVLEDIENLNDGDVIEDTKSAIVLEELIGQFLFSVSEE
ncbi:MULTISPECIES: outer membrane lipid asymmetry maintenance protein MlaD [unclassified Agarivorans]|uniref:outer membrane lipid asymmetry maintenance protein MlaD n=1 Tax=unclassified Agarivorans TaxID=2636026 RepID=UPI0026E3EA06|nr:MULTISPECIES: outer membrane lipid asymmetry maintenance protein MlaD [unclassified Agarivorans]MDO6686880.1 outer membrane lipid asymmetry maintenance protein MlaD [Agarivorans sp. 3_MG-2023]MDO6716677.1 outer membrane lipid asymmetry maintenance protein MlaD [Agarivorans sp. 2_MG-2023]MDO6764584.1 outer membrane lipid asymmetry maintenance protein MlaD [Agarivorans sp. 1_MG-2023]